MKTIILLCEHKLQQQSTVQQLAFTQRSNKQASVIILINSIMDNLQHDIKAMETRIVQWLTNYENINVLCIQEKYNAKLQGLLEGIAEFDCQKIKEKQAQFTNQVTHKYIQNIEAKIREIEKVKQTKQKPLITHSKSEIQQPRKKQSSSTASTNDKKQQKGSFFASIFKKIGNKDKKSYQIILPDKEPNCYYDQKSRSYIFEGEEPEAPKIIPKPPSMKLINKIQQSKAVSDISELNAMIAPPAFKRKGTNLSKSKTRAKQQIQIAKIQEQPLTYSLLLQKIKAEYDSLLQKIGLGLYGRLDQDKLQWDANEQMKHMIDFADRTLQYSQEINAAQNRLIQKCERILTGQNIELKLMQKIVKQCHQSHIIYDQLDRIVSQKKEVTNTLRDSQFLERIKSLEEQLLQTQSERQNMQIFLQQKSKEYEQKEQIYKNKQCRIQDLEYKINSLQNIIANLQLSKDFSQKNREQLVCDNISLEDNVVHLNKQIDVMTKHMLALNQIIKNKQKDCSLSSETISSLKQEITLLRKINDTLQIQVESCQGTLNQVNLQIHNEKKQIYNKLTICEQKEQEYLKFIKINLIQTKQNQLQDFGKHQRLQQKQIINKEQKISPTSEKRLVDIIQESSKRHLQKIEFIYQNIVLLNHKYTQGKQIQLKLKDSYAKENTIMFQSQARLKSLVESYKTAKEDADQKCSKLQFQCDKLRKKLRHYKEEEEFNRSYIFKLKTSNLGLNNDSMISLQSDNDELAQKLDSMQKQINLKNENLTKLQTDLEDLLADYQKDQFRQLQLQKRIKQYDRNLRLQKQQKQQFTNKIKLLQLKLKNQKQKIQQLINKYEIKIANIEGTHQKKFKILKQQLEQTVISNLHLKDEANEITSSFNHRLKHLEEYHLSKEQEINLLLANKQTEINKLYSLIDQYQEKEGQFHHQIQFFKRHRQTQCMRYQQLSLHMNKLVDEHLKQISILQDNEANMNGIITVILQKYKSYQCQEEEFKQTYEQKIIQLQQQLLQSKFQSEKLLQQLSNYSELVTNFDYQITRLQEDQSICKDQYEIKIRNSEQQIHKLQQTISILSQQIGTKGYENSTLKQQLQKLQEVILFMQEQIEDKRQQNVSIKSEIALSILNLKRQNEQKTQIAINRTNQLTLQLLQKQRQLLDKNQQIICKTEEIANRVEQLKQKQLLISSYIQQTQKLSIDFKQSQTHIQELKNIIQTNKEIINKNMLLENQINQLKDILEGKNSEIIRLQNDVLNTTNILEQKIHEFTMMQKLQNQVDDAQNHVNALNEAVASLSEDIQTKQRLIHSLTQELASQKSRNADYDNTFLEKEKQNVDLILKMQLKEEESAKLQEQIQNEIKVKVQTLEKIIESQQHDLSELKKQIQQTDIVVERYKEDNQILSRSIQQKERQLKTREALIQQMRNKMVDLKTNQLMACQKCIEIEKQKIDLQKIIKNQYELQSTLKQEETKTVEGIQYLESLQKLQGILLQKQVMINDKNTKINQLQLQIKSKVQSIQILEKKIEEAGNLQNINQIQKIQSNLQDQQIQNLSKIGKLRKALAQKQRQLREKTHKATDLQEKFDHMTKIIEHQRQELQSLKNEKQIQHLPTISQDNQMMENNHAASQVKLNHLNLQLQQLCLQFSLKEQTYKNKIQELQKQLLNLISLKNINKTLEDNFKALQLQNVALNNQKVELLRSNSYLMEINQKLVGVKSPHTIKDHHKSAINIAVKEPEKPQSNQPKSQIIPSEKIEQKSFFGSISNFFLTPTERDRLAK